ncbi:MAG: hypothetical protein RL885_10190 [Planctomycetota bacterium]
MRRSDRNREGNVHPNDAAAYQQIGRDSGGKNRIGTLLQDLRHLQAGRSA